MLQLNIERAIIKKGNPYHVHHEEIQRECGRLIGRCTCGRIKDYTVLHDQLFEMGDGYRNPKVSMIKIMKSRNGG
jgi:hypothetical protein